MTVPIEWLREFIDLPWSNEELVDRLINVGIAVESYENGLFGLEIMPSRGDLLSILGLARELSALTGNPIHRPASPPLPEKKPRFKIAVDPRFAPRYTSAVVRGVRVQATKHPTIIRRLTQSGIRPINNIVDATNYVMLETGQPTHAFNLGKVSGERMILRQAKRGEKLITLDGIERQLPLGALVITDSARIIDLPGIMGGKNSAIDKKTRNVVLQAAVFDPVLIRRTSRELGLSTEASYRFERRVDPDGTLTALQRLVAMVVAEAGGTVEGYLDYASDLARQPIEFEPGEIKRLLGRTYRTAEIKEILTRLGCTIDERKKLLVTPPPWRPDLTIEADLVEEIARLKGYDSLRPQSLPRQAAPESRQYFARESLKDWLVSQGLMEVMTYSLLSQADLATSGTPPTDAVRLANPLSEEQTFFRSSLLPGLLKVAAKNPLYDPIGVFEIGRVSTRSREFVQVGLLFAGKKGDDAIKIARNIGLVAKRVSQDLLKRYKIRKSNIWVALGDWQKVKHYWPMVTKLRTAQRFTVRPLPKFPPVTRDISIIVDQNIRKDEIKLAIAGTSEYIHLVELFDEFFDRRFGPGRKSLAFHIFYQHPDKTLTSEEVDHLHRAVEQCLIKEFKAIIR